MQPKYTDEQVKDIEEREKKGIEALRELELTPGAILRKINVGEDVFADKVFPYLQDTKYAPKPEPVAETVKEDDPVV